MTADAFRRRQREGPHLFTQNRPRSFVAALQDVTAEEKSKNQLSRDFWCCPIFDFCNSIPSGADVVRPPGHVRKVPRAEVTTANPSARNWFEATRPHLSRLLYI